MTDRPQALPAHDADKGPDNDAVTVVTPTAAVRPGSSSSSSSSSSNCDDAQSIAASIGNQRMLMPKKTLLVAVPALSVALFVSFIDQTGVSTTIPAVSAELDTGAATSWIGASFLIASTAFQLINGRLSDIFGRKNCLLLCLGLIALGDVLSGFAKTKEQLFAFRAVAGVGGGGINSIVMIIVSDITTLENRGKYQGILGAVIALANGTGPFLGGALVEKLSWRWIFWLIPMLAVPAAIAILFFLPVKHERGNYVAKVKMIDYGGIALNLAAVLLILIPLSGGGDMYAWSSGQFIGMITVGGFLAVAFVLYEWKLAPVPIMPLRLFQAKHCPYMYGQSLMMGIGFYGNFFYMPIYFQSVLGYSALESGALILPLIISTSACSIGSGQFMSRVGRYMPCVAVGFGMWTLGTGLKCMFSQTTHIGVVIGVLIVEGLGVGLTLQPTLVGLLANSRSEDRAVCTGLRNFIRTIGGAFGLIISGAILSNTLSSQLSGLPFISKETISGLTSSAYGLDKLGLTSDEKELVLTVYMRGLHYIFIFYAACVGSAFVMCAGIGNTSLKAKTPKPPAEETSQVRSESDASVGGEKSKGTTAEV
ncbi:Major facilitator superfamily transporter [Coniochaeta hoffmannii]|uniref:Major facilitator superfamily transporter n=1 Tax=Coniochaeta hoffmannii TaxID=91930 RepID=A0AA38VKT1_9PEZI|nr:Major facilitator superfamily transporter [Coniochaeta hoffmannii]